MTMTKWSDKEKQWQVRSASASLATYLLHLFQRRAVDTELLEVILRGGYHSLDDLLVDSTLMSLSVKLSFTHPLPA
jgi:hypothetical protein